MISRHRPHNIGFNIDLQKWLSPALFTCWGIGKWHVVTPLFYIQKSTYRHEIAAPEDAIYIGFLSKWTQEPWFRWSSAWVFSRRFVLSEPTKFKTTAGAVRESPRQQAEG